jgi:hypothetical protein
VSAALASRWALVALLVAGLVLMIPFEYTLTRAAGIACLLAFIVVGVFQIAEPGFLGGDQDPRDG